MRIPEKVRAHGSVSARKGVNLEISEIQRLPLRCDPTPGESFNAFLTRLSERNDSEQVSWVAGAAGVRFPKVTYTDEEVQRLALLADRDFSLLRQLAPIHPESGEFGKITAVSNKQIPYRLLVQDGRRFCPGCFALKGIADRIEWGFRFVRACPVHRIQLVERCPNCRDKIRWRKNRVDQCQCGLTFECIAESLPFIHVDKGATHGPGYLLDLLFDRVSEVKPPLCSELRFIEIFEAAFALGMFGAPRGDLRTLDDTMDQALGFWLTRGLHHLAQDPETFAREVWRLTPKRFGLPSKKHFRVLQELHRGLVSTGANDSTLAKTLAQMVDPYVDYLG